MSAHAAPREIEFKDKLPKTRSGKIMRRVLKSLGIKFRCRDLVQWNNDMNVIEDFFRRIKGDNIFHVNKFK